jgi:hypothetical protein
LSFFLEIVLIADDEPDGALVDILLDLREPDLDVIKGSPVSDVVHHDDPVRSPIVTAGDRLEPVLPRSVPLNQTISTICSLMLFPRIVTYFMR